MRSVSMDTETTGSNFQKGDRVIEVGLVELVDGRRTGNTYQTYLKPDVEVGFFPFKIHGISNAFLEDKPLFEDKAAEMLAFIDGAPCLAHGARFDRDAFINEFHVTGLDLPILEFFDTVSMAKKMVQGPKFKLDTLVEKLGIETPNRDLHGALLDADILAMIVQNFEETKPGFVEAYLKASSALDPLPKFLSEKTPAQIIHRSGAINPQTGWVAQMGVTPVGGDKRQLELMPQKNFGTGDPEDINPGVAGKIEKINKTTGELTKEARRLFRTNGNDVWSSTPVKVAATFAVKAHGKEAVREALKEAQGRQIEKGMRWICRGVSPDRVGAFIRGINRNERVVKSTSKLDISDLENITVTPEGNIEDDSPGMG
jgi:DNA polymerase-3 subunit epsilon